MSLKNIISSKLPISLKNFIKKNFRKHPLSNYICTNLTSLICVDVGASYFPHGKWFLFLNSPKTQWIAVEPNKKNLEYTKNWIYRCKIETIESGLSQNGGEETLYVTNIDSGSSLYLPIIEEGMKHRINKRFEEYLFPFKEQKINTLSLNEVINSKNNNDPIIIKLDTQGSELSILQGAEDAFMNQRIVGIEMESSLLAQPIMKGAKKFWHAQEYLEEKGFELIDIDIIRAIANRELKNGKGYVNECDAVFILRRDILNKLPLGYRLTALTFYLCYQLYEEAITMLEYDAEIQNHFNNNKVQYRTLVNYIAKLA